jgi:hypothetical protein
VKGGSRAKVEVNLRLASQRSACVIWFDYDSITFELGPFRWFGGDPGEYMKSPGSRVARRTTPNGLGEKPVRNRHRRLVKGQFEKLNTIGQLADRLFGPASGAHAERQRLLDHLTLRPVASEAWIENARIGRFSHIPESPDDDQSSAFAEMINGYELLGPAIEANQFLQQQVDRARASRRWEGSATSLWITLFLEHRRRRFVDGDHDDALFHELKQELRRQLITLENL